MMIRSMTGYGKAERVLAGRKFVVEMKSVHHRYLEVSLRLPGLLLSLEAEVKKRIGEQFSRGRIEAIIRIDMEGTAEGGSRFSLNLPLIRNYHALLSQMKKELGLEDEISLSVMAGFREAFVPLETLQEPGTLWEDLSPVLAEAIDMLKEMRQREGVSLKRDLEDRLSLIDGYLERIAGRAPQVVLEYQERLGGRVPGMTGATAGDEA